MSKRNKKRKDIQGYRQKQRKREAEVTRTPIKPSVWITVLLCIILALTTAVLCWTIFKPEEPELTTIEQMEQQAESYIEDKYGKDFTLTTSLPSGLYLFSYEGGTQEVGVYHKNYFNESYGEPILKHIKTDFVDDGYLVFHEDDIINEFKKCLPDVVLAGKHRVLTRFDTLFTPPEAAFDMSYTEFNERYPEFTEPFVFVLTDQFLTQMQLDQMEQDFKNSGLSARLRVLYATESEQKNADPSMLIYNLRNNPNLLLAENINMEE